MSEMTEFQQRASAAALVKMLNKDKHFNICGLDAIAKTMGRAHAMAGRDYEALRSVHCMDWADMGQDLARQVREKCLELLGLPPQVIDTIEPEKPSEPAHASAKRLSLAWWRRA